LGGVFSIRLITSSSEITGVFDMPPQPISNTPFYRKQPKGRKMLGWIRGPRPFDWRKSLGTPFANVISTCAMLEHELTDLLIKMTGPHASVAWAMHGVLSSTTSQIAAMRGAASIMLDDRELELFEVIVKIAQKAIGERNTVAHGLWVHDDQWPDAMILLPSDEYHGRQLGSAGRAKIPPGRKPLGHNADRMLIYREREFDEITGRILGAINHVRHIAQLIGETKPEAKNGVYLSLSNAPGVAEALAQRRKHPRNKKAAPKRRPQKAAPQSKAGG
jgi:hypothetical protein